MANETPVPPAVLWAQRKEDIFLTFSIESKDPNIKIEKESVYFKGTNAQDNKVHEVNIPLYGAVDPDNSLFVNKGRCIEMLLRKENKTAPYWPSLTKDKKKPHYLKIDFNKWRDEDSDGEDNKVGNEEDGNKGGGAMDFMDLYNSMYAGGDKKQDKPSFDDLEGDSDDENLPDLE